MDYRLSYMESVEDNFPHELASSVNPCVNLKIAFDEAELAEPNHLKIYLRIRPQLSDERNETKVEHVEILNDQSIAVLSSNHAQSHKNSTKISHNFTFSHVYGSDSSQKLIFDQTTEELVRDVINGQNCLLFTYGATNSGKTYTAQGTADEPGLLPRTFGAVFDKVGPNQYLQEDLKPHHFCSVIRLSESEIKKERDIKDSILRSRDFSRVSACSNFSSISCFSKEYDHSNLPNIDNTQNSTVFDITQGSTMSSPCYSVFVSFAEIYNEYVYDLLENITTHKNIKRMPLVLGEDRLGSIYIKGLKHIKVCSAEEATQVLEVGRQNLHFASTHLNQNSSRSHCIFTIKLVRLFDPSNPHLATTSMLSLCDLAGAERAAKTLNSHDRLKEASNINTSLLVLGRCIAALRHNQSVKHSIGTKKVMPVPYRDSKVTRLFQSFFMGKGLLTMIVNISTSYLTLDDTLKVLKFSAIARKVAIVPNKAYIDHRVEKQRERSRFSQFMRHSLNMSKGSVRFSVPWANSTTTDVTFGGAETEAETTCDETYEEESSHEVLLDLIKKLRDRLISATKENQEMEQKLRKEICDSFSQRIIEIQNSYRIRIEEERFRNEELMDWRVNRALETTSCSKRPRISEGEDGRRSVLSHFQDELKLQETTEERDLLKEEFEAVKATLKSATQSAKLVQEENSKLTFQLSVATESLEAAESEKENANKVIKAALSGGQQAASAVIERQEQKIDHLMRELENKQEETNTINLLLKEAAEEFIEKDEQLMTTQKTVKQQNLVLSNLENELCEVKELLARHVINLDEREKTICELRNNKQCNITANTASYDPTTRYESNVDGRLPQCKQQLANKYRFNLLKSADKNQSLIDFETSEKKINKQQLRVEQTNRLKSLEDCLSKTDEKCQKLREELDATLDKEANLVTKIQANETEIISLKKVQEQFECLQIANKELLEENSKLKLMVDDSSAAEDKLSQSLVNNEDLSRCGEAPEDSVPEIDDLRRMLQALKLNSMQELEEVLLKTQSKLEETTKKLNETDEELVSMCKLNQSLQEELLTNRNKINFLESSLFGAREDLRAATEDASQLINFRQFAHAELKRSAEKDKEIVELKNNLSHMREMSSKLGKEILLGREKEATLESQVESYTNQLKEFTLLRVRLKNMIDAKLALEEESDKLKVVNQTLEASVLDHTCLIKSLTNKMESLDKKLAENECKASENEVLSKQLAAVSEARREEQAKYESTIEEKNSEILVFQKEYKDLLIEKKKGTDAKDIKQEEDSTQIIEEQLRKSELERTSLICHVSDLERQLTDKFESCKLLEAELNAFSFSKKSNSTVEIIEQSQCADGFVTPMPASRSTKSRSALKNRSVQVTELEDKEPKTKTRSAKSKRQNVTFCDTLVTSCSQDTVESSCEDTPVVETSTRRSNRRPRGRAKKTLSVPNPHIQDEKDKENNADLTSENRRSTRRKRRPLYTVADDQTLDGSPDLTTHDNHSLPEESPHTISRRQLRSKFK